MTEPRTRVAPRRRRAPPILPLALPARRRREETARALAAAAECACAPRGALPVAWLRLLAAPGPLSAGEADFRSHLALGKQCPSAPHRALEGADAAGFSSQAAVEAQLPPCARIEGHPVDPSRAAHLTQAPSSPARRSPLPSPLLLPGAHTLSGPFPVPDSRLAVPSSSFVCPNTLRGP